MWYGVIGNGAGLHNQRREVVGVRGNVVVVMTVVGVDGVSMRPSMLEVETFPNMEEAVENSVEYIQSVALEKNKELCTDDVRNKLMEEYCYSWSGESPFHIETLFLNEVWKH